MKIVLDTNILLTIISSKSSNRILFENLIDDIYILCFTNEILEEYAEIIGAKMGQKVSEVLMKLLVELPNIQLVNRYFSWNLIHNDSVDNKFVDCAIACNADFMVSEDNHFNVLSKIPFPKVSVLKVSDFVEILQNLDK